MKRRNFLINSMAALGGCTILSGCKKEEIKKDSVIRRKFKDIKVPLLGFGCARFPMKKNNNIDMVELDKMIEYLMNHGVNYFDTGYFYVNFKSETALGEILKKYPRNSYFLADKMPVFKLRDKKDIKRIFDEQLKKCGVDYFDFYMEQGIGDDYNGIRKNTQVHQELLELKKEGKIKYLGFSLHGSIDFLKEIISEEGWDFCQLQLNYFDWNILKAKEQYEVAKKAKLPVVVMEPLRGGGLIHLPNEASEELKDITPSEFALRWAGSLDNVITVLSGMSNLGQVKDNVAVFENFKAMTNKEKETAQKISEIIQSKGEINCTGCKYCIDSCPKGINIPAIFAVYNQYLICKNSPSEKISTIVFRNNYIALDEKERAHNCIKCGLCNKACTQGLNIPELLDKIDNEFKNIKPQKV